MQSENKEVKHESLNSKEKDSKESKSGSSKKNRKNRRTLNKIDIKAKLERSRQSARECRARKKLRYQYLEDLVVKRERANLLLRKELELVIFKFKIWVNSVQSNDKLNHNNIHVLFHKLI